MMTDDKVCDNNPPPPPPPPHSGSPSILDVNLSELPLIRAIKLHVSSRGSFETAVKLIATLLNDGGTETVNVMDNIITIEGLEYEHSYNINVTAVSIDCPEAGIKSNLVPFSLELDLPTNSK